jgi:hypothetical protein
MSRVQKVLVEARRLSRDQRKKLVAALERELRAERRAPRHQSSRSASAGKPAKQVKKRGPYQSFLDAAGTVHSDFTDISSDKYKHVAAAILGERT